MLKQLYANNAITTLATSVNPSDTVIQVASAAKFPKPQANEYFRVTIDSGTGIEVLFVFGVSGDSFINCLRGQEGTVAQAFQPGTNIECRVTAGTLAQFARYQDRLADITSVDVLSPPNQSDANSYICATPDDVGNPIVTIARDDNTWRFIEYATVALNGQATGGNTVSLTYSSPGNVQLAFAGKYIVQFLSGPNQGLARMVTGADETGITWNRPLPVAVNANDAFEIYQSTASSINDMNLSINNGLIFAILFSE